MTSMPSDSMTEQEELEYLQDFQEKQRIFYLQQEKQSMKENWLTHLSKRQYFLPNDLINLVLSFIPEYYLIWFTNGQYNISIKTISLHNEFLENRSKVIRDHDSFVNHEECDCGVCSHFNQFYFTEYDQFYFIANSMDVQIVSLCPSESYNDYNQFKSNNPDVKQRIVEYFYADWHKDSLLNLHISWMKRVCLNRIPFCYELLPEFYQWANKKHLLITYQSIHDFINKLLHVTTPNATDLNHATNIKLFCDKCTSASFDKKPHIIAKAYRYMSHFIHYVRQNTALLETSIRKAHEFKYHTRNIRAILAIDYFLSFV